MVTGSAAEIKSLIYLLRHAATRTRGRERGRACPLDAKRVRVGEGRAGAPFVGKGPPGGKMTNVGTLGTAPRTSQRLCDPAAYAFGLLRSWPGRTSRIVEKVLFTVNCERFGGRYGGIREISR